MSQRKINIIITLLVTLLFFVVLFNRIVMINGPAITSIIYKPFNGGIDEAVTYGEGVYFIWPWNNTYQFNIREQLVNDTLNIMVRDGVTVSVRINYRYYPIKDSLPVIFRRYGPNYHHVFVQPEVLYAVRERVSSFKPEEIYTLKLDSLKIEALKSSLVRVRQGNVMISDVLILDIKLPPYVVESIENKLREQQLSAEYNFKIEIAEKEKTIKMIEAQAIKIAEDTINKGLTDKYLQFKQIEAFQKLSVSPNAKTIIIPQGAKNPLILTGQ